jgi:proline iminopeptidase
VQSGNPVGEPLIFLHGGPGSGHNPDHRRLFDPARFRIVQFDQRGCGLSTPHGSLERNTTPHLVADTLRLAQQLGLRKFHLAGGSWGSTLALAFADAHPEYLASLVIYGVFLCRDRELAALYLPGGIAAQVYPDLFAPYLELLPEADRADPIEGYGKLFRSNDPARRNEALAAWTRLEMKMLRLVVPDAELEAAMTDTAYVLSHSLLENHYFRHRGFIDGSRILREIGGRLRGIPVHIVAGRYDMVCPMITAWELHKAMPGSHLTIVPAAGHSFREPGVTDALMRAGEALPVLASG